ncbi:28659_t:CDS:2, partial [Racocetra persica]
TLKQLDDKVEEAVKKVEDKCDETVKQVEEKCDESFKQISDQIDAVAQRIDFMQTTKQGDANKIEPSELMQLEIVILESVKVC